MRFTDVLVTALQAASADPRASPGTVPDTQIIDMPRVLTNSDSPPNYFVFVLEGTAAETLDVTLWAKFQPATDQPFGAAEVAANRRFYKIGVLTTLTVGVAKTLPAVRGPVYIQTGVGPAHDCILRVASMMAPIP